MRILRKRIRRFFVLQAVLMCFAGCQALTHPLPDDLVSPFRYYAFVAAYFVSSVMFLGAWWTTREASEFRNPVAMAASVISIAIGGYISWTAHVNGGFSRSGATSVVLGIGGLYIFSQGGSASSKSEAETSAQTPAKTVSSIKAPLAAKSAPAPRPLAPATPVEPLAPPVPGYFDPVAFIRDQAKVPKTSS